MTRAEPHPTTTHVPFRTAVGAHLQDFLRRPGDVPAVVAGNAALAGAAWFLLPAHWQAWVFSLHGPLALPVVLGAWMLADTPATNVLAHEDASTDVLAGTARCRRWIAARSVALGTLTGLPCLVVALALGATTGSWTTVLLASVAIVLGPVGVLPLAAWLGLWLPYRPLPLRERWRHRRAWRTQLRWALLVVAPYALVPALSAVLVAPALLVEHALTVRPSDLSPAQATDIGSTLAATLLVAGGIGVLGAGFVVRRRHDALAGFLRSTGSNRGLP